MTLIKALLRDQVLTLIETPVIASGGVEEDVVSFDFGVAAWDGYTKKAVFYRDESDVYHVDIGSDNTAVIPWEVLRQEGFMFLGVFGTKGSEIKTSTVARYRVENGAITTASELNPTPNIYNDIIANTAARHSHDNKTVLDGITADDVAKWRGTIGTFRINVTYSNEAYSADKTFDEIKAAYEAGQQPYVVLTGGTFDLVYTLASFSVPDGTGQEFVDFNRYLIWEDTLATEMLRIYSFTTGSGSNIVRRTEEFNVPKTLPNPNALTIKIGSTTVTYDGSTAQTVTIADGTEVEY